jgi:CheY-like chemotaxis protein
MPKKILFIENDSSFAAPVAESLEASGFEVRVTGDGKEGLDLAREWGPQAVVLCVELPGMSGYLVCQKLKKDDDLKALPLVLTSAEATEETFEKHRTLKARADDYLLKPYDPEALLEKLGELVGLPEGAALPPAEEEIVSLEEEVGIEGSADGSPDRELPGLDLESLPDEPPAQASGGGLDDDLKLLDEAFDGIAAPAAKDAAAALDELTSEKPVAGDEVDAAAASLPEEDEGAAHADLGALDAEAEAALGALGGEDETLSPGMSIEPEPPTRPVRGASAELLRAAGVKLLSDEEPVPRASAPAIILPALGAEPPRAASPAAEREAGELRAALERARGDVADREAEIRELEGKVRDAERRAGEAEGEAEHARGKADGLAAQLRKTEADVRAGRDEARRAADQAKEAEARAAELEEKLAEAQRRAEAAEADVRRKAEEAAVAAEAIAKAEALEREADELRTELLVARGEAEGARNEVEKRTAELRKRVADVEASAQKNEERVVKAYQKIKADEKVREKVRKALAIAMQLLDEGLPAETAAEKERRAASGSGRE